MPIQPTITGVVTGCFDGPDGLHDGHKYFLNYAANYCDWLYIYVNRDRYCQRKGADRPLAMLSDRIERIQRFAWRLPCRRVAVRVLMEDHPRAVLSIIQPDVYVLGDDYRGQLLPGVQYVQRVIFVPRVAGISTTALARQAGN